MSTPIRYTEPALCHYDFNLKKSWFVYFEIQNTETKVKIRKQFRAGINYSKSKDERLLKGRALVKYWSKKLQNGWNPFEADVKERNLLSMGFTEALNFALSKCEVSAKTLSAYRTTARCVNAGAKATGLSNKPVSDIKRMHIKLMLESAKNANNWSNTSYNNYLNFLKGILKRLIDWEILENNPAYKIPNLPVAETEKYLPYTQAEKDVIQEYLYLHHYRFFVFFLTGYFTGIRPKEILSLQIKHIDLINMQITILPDIETENSKTRKIRKVPISKHLLPFLRELDLQNYSRECYVFGSPFVSGKGNSGSSKRGIRGAFHPDYFKPSMVQIKRDTVTRFWEKIVKQKLGIDKYLYASKKTSANAMILAGIDLESIRMLFGHSSKVTTEIYATEVKKVRFNDIIENAPKF